MLNDTTINKLYEMKLGVMAQTFKEQLTDSSFTSLSFEERLGLIVDSEWATRKNNRSQKAYQKRRL